VIAMPEAVTSEFGLGAVVELKSGGPAMTIRKISGGLIDCEWFKDATLRKATFELHSLKRVIRAKTHEERLEELARLEESGE
jgi:uncharacterized protein YodC (DUF2158 family)